MSNVKNEGKVLTGLKGKVKFFLDKKGFGYIELDGKQQCPDVMVHHTAIQMSGYKTLEAGQVVTLDVTLNENGKGLLALNVVPEEMPRMSAEEALNLLASE